MRRIPDFRYPYLPYFNISAMPTILKLPVVSHPWAYFVPCFQSHTSVCSFQQVPKSTPSLRPLRLRNFKEQSLKLSRLELFIFEGDCRLHLHSPTCRNNNGRHYYSDKANDGCRPRHNYMRQRYTLHHFGKHLDYLFFPHNEHD